MNNIAEYSAIVVIVLFLIKEMFGFLKARKVNGNASKVNLPDNLVEKLARIDEKLDNHITHFCGDLSEAKTAIKETQKDIFDIKVELVKITAMLKSK